MAIDAVSAAAALPGLAQTLDRQRRFFSTHVTKDPAFRQQALRKLQRLVEKNEERISRSLYEDLRKSPFEAYTSEIGLVKNEIRFRNPKGCEPHCILQGRAASTASPTGWS